MTRATWKYSVELETRLNFTSLELFNSKKGAPYPAYENCMLHFNLPDFQEMFLWRIECLFPMEKKSHFRSVVCRIKLNPFAFASMIMVN